jgi:hypothetical protein
MHKTIGNRNHKTDLLTFHTLIRFEIKSLADNSSFQIRFRTRSGNIHPKNPITLEKMATPHSQEKNTLEFLEQYRT